ncbi:MAG: response regulator [Verrucomicrobia bacterium]|nr:response regulator [Verrucomicrobiota bacterium]
MMILVVDDSKALVESIGGSLERLGYTVAGASNAVDAFDHLRNPQCRLMLLSMDLPRLTGAELLILMGAEAIEVPVIVMASMDDLSADEMAEFPDVVDFIRKPFPMDELVEKVQRHARRGIAD